MSHAASLSLVALMLAVPAAHAVLVTKTFAGTVAVADPVFGPKGVGSTFGGSFTYEDDPTLNPDLEGGASLPTTAAFRWTSFTIEAVSFAHSEGSGLGRQQDITLFNDIGPPLRDQIQIEGLFGGIVYTLAIRGTADAYTDVSEVSVLDPLTGADFSPAPTGLTVGPIRLIGPTDLNGGPTFIFAGVAIASAVPEPSPLALGVLGLGGVLGYARRRRR